MRNNQRKLFKLMRRVQLQSTLTQLDYRAYQRKLGASAIDTSETDYLDSLQATLHKLLLDSRMSERERFDAFTELKQDVQRVLDSCDNRRMRLRAHDMLKRAETRLFAKQAKQTRSTHVAMNRDDYDALCVQRDTRFASERERETIIRQNNS